MTKGLQDIYYRVAEEGKLRTMLQELIKKWEADFGFPLSLADGIRRCIVLTHKREFAEGKRDE